MIKVNDSTVVIDLKGNTKEDKAHVIGELTVAVKGVSEVIGIKHKKLLKLVKESLDNFEEIEKGVLDVKEN